MITVLVGYNSNKDMWASDQTRTCTAHWRSKVMAAPLSASPVACVCRWDPMAGNPASPQPSSHWSWLLHPQARISPFPSAKHDRISSWFMDGKRTRHKEKKKKQFSSLHRNHAYIPVLEVLHGFLHSNHAVTLYIIGHGIVLMLWTITSYYDANMVRWCWNRVSKQ